MKTPEKKTPSLTKKEISRLISEELDLPHQKAHDILQKTFEVIVDALVAGRRVELRNFGVFEVKKRAARKGRNPVTGDDIEVPAKHVVSFKAGKRMKAEVKKIGQPRSSESGFIPRGDD
jgi:integration host factor subunit beta